MSLTDRGVNYDTGTNFFPDGSLSRQSWREDLMRREIRAIRDELHANAVGIYGTDLDRLVATATAALEDGLSVWLQPRLVNATAEATLDHLAKIAAAVEPLRQRHEAVSLNVGCELSVFSAGIIPGDGYQERSSKLGSPRYWPRLPWYNRKLNVLLRTAAAVARSSFGGPITYGAGLWERVDWGVFDVVGLDYYRIPYNRSRYVQNLRKFRRLGKPVVIVEFGSASFEGAVEAGPSSHEIIDWSRPVPEIRGAHVRDERIQADQIGELLDIYDAEGIDGAFVFEFIEPFHPHAADPRYDLDMAGYGIVKVLPGDGGEPYRWEPKLTFHEIARRYGPDRAKDPA